MIWKVFKRAHLVTMFVIFACLGGCIVRAPIHPVAAKLNMEAARALSAGRPEQARAPLLVALEYNPCYAGALHNLALVEFMGGALDKAWDLELEALECQDDLVQAINGLGLIARRRGEQELALEWFEHALEVDPGCTDARRNLIDTLKSTGRSAQARAEGTRLKALE